MTNLDFVLLPVRDPMVSAQTCAVLLGRQPVEQSPTFVMFVLPTGLKVGLWAAKGMTPTPSAPGGSELAFTFESREALHAAFDAWTKAGLAVLLAPSEADFGLTFVVRDGDGHRWRGFVPRA